MAPGVVAEIARAREIVPNVNPIAQTARAAGGLVVYVYSPAGKLEDISNETIRSNPRVINNCVF